MSKTELLQEVLAEMEAGHAAQAAEHFADDLVFLGPAPKPMDKKTFLDFMQSLVSAVPDWKFHVTEPRETGNVVRVKFHIKGTNTGVITLPQLGIVSPAPTGKCFALPEEPVRVLFSGDKIVQWSVAAVPGGGVAGIMKQIGIAMPERAKVRS